MSDQDDIKKTVASQSVVDLATYREVSREGFLVGCYVYDPENAFIDDKDRVAEIPCTAIDILERVTPSKERP